MSYLLTIYFAVFGHGNLQFYQTYLSVNPSLVLILDY